MLLMVDSLCRHEEVFQNTAANLVPAQSAPDFNSDQAEIICDNAEEIISYILDVTPYIYIPEWRCENEK